MQINTHLYSHKSSNGGFAGKVDAGWTLWIVEDGLFEDRQNLVMSWQFPVKPTKKQIRKLRRQFRKENPPLTAHEEVVISVLGM